MRFSKAGPHLAAGTLALAIGACLPTAVATLPPPGPVFTSRALEEATARLASAFHLGSLSTQAPLNSPVTAAGALAAFTAPKQAANPALAYAPTDGGIAPDAPLVAPTLALPSKTPAERALAAYRLGDLAAGDALATGVEDAGTRTALEWAALRFGVRTVAASRLTAFLDTHSGWPSAAWIRRRVEDALMRDHADAATVRAAFARRAPEAPTGRFAMAKVLRADGKLAEATTLVRTLWRTDDFDAAFETIVRKDFGDLRTRADYKARADRLLYKGKASDALRSAALAGPDVAALAKARAAVWAEEASDKAMAAVPPELRRDPGYVFASVQRLRRAGKLGAAALLLATAPRDAALLVDPDAWWAERRMVARKLLDAGGDARTAYALCAETAGLSRDGRVEAALNAGWIALRFLTDPALAAPHFALAAGLAEAPGQRARALYWQGRTAELQDRAEAASGYYRAAAGYDETYYGQLARAKSDDAPTPFRGPLSVAEGRDRNEAVETVETLLTLGARDLAQPLAIDAARSLRDGSQVAALAAVALRSRDARLALGVGKVADSRGYLLPDAAFPTFGVPAYEPLPASAPSEIVYAVARQESAFDAAVVSKAGAKGLMQMIDATAQRTAQQRGLAFDAARMLSDPAFNAQLGAAHLGQLLSEQGQSLILTFVAYNAGPKRAREWIDAYGDPRDPKVDAVDWVERIPFTETRNYVQRVMENVAMYRARFGAARTTLQASAAPLSN